jgi:hypothetical protein
MLESLAQLLQKTTKDIILFEPERPSVSELILKATLVSQIPVSVRSQIGLLANELRAILDGLACTLAIRNSGDCRQTYFPITQTEEFFENESKRKLRLVSEADVAKIRDLRPWGGGHPVLFKLHEADRIRKHRKLLGCAGGTDISVLDGTLGKMVLNPAIFTEIGQSEVILHAVDTKMNFEITTSIGYIEEGYLKNVRAGELLEDSYTSVRDILTMFA